MKQIYICSSGIHGKGIFAGEDIKRGELIQPIKGPLKFKVNKTDRDTFGNPNWIGIANNQWIDPEKPFKFINHSCDANAGVRGKICIVALRDIKEGEEITIDYSIIEGDENWSMPCRCGAKNCRKIVRSIVHLPQKRFAKYMPYIPTYFKKLYMRYNKIDEAKKVQD